MKRLAILARSSVGDHNYWIMEDGKQHGAGAVGLPQPIAGHRCYDGEIVHSGLKQARDGSISLDVEAIVSDPEIFASWLECLERDYPDVFEHLCETMRTMVKEQGLPCIAG